MSRHNSGYTLIELLVVIVITTLVAIPLTTFAIRGLRSYSFIEAQSNTSTDLSSLSGRITRVIRGATNLETADPNSLIMYGYFSPQDTVIKRIRYFVNGRNLNIGVTPPTGTAPNFTYLAQDEVVTTVRVDLSMGSTPLFSYYDDAGGLLSGAFTPGQVKVVGVYLAANPATKLNPTPISLSTKVTLRNLKVNL